MKAKAQAPTEIRTAWRKAHPNSIIRRKYPTMVALNRAWLRGELLDEATFAKKTPTIHRLRRLQERA